MKRTKSADAALREITGICAQHKAELMYESIYAESEYDHVKCFELHGYTVQTAV